MAAATGIKSFPNRREGKCEACGVVVGPQKGRCFRLGGDGRWAVSCVSSVCASKLGLAGAEPAAAPERRLTAEGCVVTPYEPDNLALFRSFPGARWDKDARCWRVSLELGDRTRVLELADKLGLEVDAALRAVPKDQEGLRAACLLAGLYPFQVKGAMWLARRQKALLGDSMGLGKTPQALLALPQQVRGLVVCPASLKYSWQDECKRWRPDLEPVVLSGRKSFRAPKAGELVIVNFEILPPAPKKGQEHPLAEELAGVYLVLDEAAFVKNYKAARTKAVRALSGACAATWFLTGTPLMNHPFDLWGMLDAGGMAKDVFGSWFRFVRLFGGERDRWGGWSFSTPSEEVPERLRRVMLRRTKEEVLPDLPPVTTTSLTVNGLDKALKKDLDTAWAAWCGSVGDVNLAAARSHALALGISWDLHGDHDWPLLHVFLDAVEAGVEMPAPEGVRVVETEKGVKLSDGRGAQGPRSLPPFERFSELRERLACSRIPALLDLVAQYEQSDTPVVVFSHHREPVETLARREGWVSIIGDMSPKRRNENVRRFQDGACKGIALTITAGGTGLTLTRASHVIFVDQDWRPAMNSQATDRVRRIGQEADAINVTNMVSDHPLDQRVLELLTAKQRMIEAAVEACAEAAPPRPEKAASSPFREESEEEQAARAKAVRDAERAVERAKQARRVAYILQGEKARAATPEPELTPERREAIKGAFEHMLSVCDGAVKRDAHGFNKPDAVRAQILVDFDLDSDESAMRAAERMLARYHRQLGQRFPVLFA